jgi:SOS-response transcriptional repressor LexA
MTTPGERIREARFVQRMSQAQLAKNIPMPGAILSKIERNVIKESKYHRLISNFLKIDFNWMMTGEGFKREDDIYGENDKNFPILEGSEVVLWCLNKLSSKEIFVQERKFCSNPYGKSERKRKFAFRISDDFMMTDRGISFHPGTVVIFDPDRKFNNNDFVLVMTSTGLPVLYQYVIAGDIPLLKHLNPNYPIQELTIRQSIIGVAVARLDVFY